MRSPFSTGPDRLEPRRYLQRRMWTTNSDRRVKYLLPFVVTSALAGCAGPRTTVGDGFLQKRQHLSGWHLDMGKRDHGRSEPVRSKVERMHIRDVEPGSSARLKRPVPSSGTVSSTQDGTLASTSNSISDAIGSSKMHPSNLPLDRSEIPTLVDDEQPERRWNPWAIPAFAVALGTVAYAILGTSELIVVAAVILTIVLAAIAVRRGRMNEWSGKGFAVSALIIGCLSALITVIALLNGGG